MRKKGRERPNRIVEINGTQRKLNRVISKTDVDLHHIMGQCNKHLYNIWIEQNKIKLPRRKHVALNNFFGNKQDPREQLKDVYEIVKNVLSPEIRRELYTILYEADDNKFYIPELLKGKKKTKKFNSLQKEKCQSSQEILDSNQEKWQN